MQLQQYLVKYLNSQYSTGEHSNNSIELLSTCRQLSVLIIEVPFWILILIDNLDLK